VRKALERLVAILRAVAAPATLRLVAVEPDTTGERVAPVASAPTVVISPRALEHAVLNLVINAREAMSSRAGRITVTVGAEQVPAGSDLDVAAGRYVTVTVADNGPGMRHEVLDHAFESFYTTKAHGTGLGLPSVLRIARGAGGTASIESTPGAGTTVTLLLPEAAPH
jgi:signal transduction histidine kinase